MEGTAPVLTNKRLTTKAFMNPFTSESTHMLSDYLPQSLQIYFWGMGGGKERITSSNSSATCQ